MNILRRAALFALDLNKLQSTAAVKLYGKLGLYKKLVIRNGRLIGAVLFGDTADALWYLDLIRTGEPTGRFRNELAFGRALAERKSHLDMAA